MPADLPSAPDWRPSAKCTSLRPDDLIAGRRHERMFITSSGGSRRAVHDNPATSKRPLDLHPDNHGNPTIILTTNEPST
ncbi:hypothetical protein PDE_05877 [Penicillium oxalicum 114-2]|uniref:Uncharacterized protein n=1 Tax=Penicillium oxalicum (strain 114-2 / CGMCC 5302) TaxID=933388 RepID=S7ZKV1_PENO1|nr:hypothetical protein PDE_05877 [Penicillium oxalicum 114-2]